MAGKRKTMSQIKQVLRQYKQGVKIKTIARNSSISRNTIKAYLKKIKMANWSIVELLKLDDPELNKKFHAGNPAYKEDRYDRLKDRLDYYANELKRTGVTKQLLWDEYRLDDPTGYSHSQFKHHLLQHTRTASPSMVLSHQPGEKLMIDFAGKTLSYIDQSTGEIIQCQVFVATLPFSDYGFAMAVRTQKISDFIHALSCCLQALGGAPQVIVPDNLKSAVIRPSRYESSLNQVMEDFSNHHDITVLPARVRKPKDKALVENLVKLVYNRVSARIRDQQFFSLGELNTAIFKNMRLHNQTRMQEKPYCREERFLAMEQQVLKPLPEEPFEIKTYKELKVAMNNHIRLSEDKHYYSVPYQHIGQKSQVIYTRTMVRIYVKGEKVATHIRSYSQGGYSTKKEHLCSTHLHYLNRSPDYYLEKAKEQSDKLYELFVQLFKTKRYPEQLYRSCDGLLSLQRKNEAKKMDKACEIAIANENYSYRFILNILQNNMTDHQETPSEIPLPIHGNIRGKDYYNQLTIKH
jgi:transposase